MTVMDGPLGRRSSEMYIEYEIFGWQPCSAPWASTSEADRAWLEGSLR